VSRGFAWDPEVRLRNVELHGLDFIRAALIFEGPVLLVEDAREEYGASRCRALGAVDGMCVMLYYEMRDGHRWLLAARKVEEHAARTFRRRLAGRHPGNAKAG